MKNFLPLKDLEAIIKTGSIRKAAEERYITASALNRRIISLEEELGIKLFERLATGVKLSTAGEIYLHFMRNQQMDMERLQTLFTDLADGRKGHVSIASSQAFLSSFLPAQIAEFRERYPEVTFSVNIRDRNMAEEALIDLTADLALVFEPIKMNDFQTLATAQQPILAVMQQNHPLANKPYLKLSDYVDYPVALPNSNYGVRHIIESALQKKMIKFSPKIQSDSFEFLRQYILYENMVTFQIGLGLPPKDLMPGMICRDMTETNLPYGKIFLGQLNGRTLSVAAAKFAVYIQEALDSL